MAERHSVGRFLQSRNRDVNHDRNPEFAGFVSAIRQQDESNVKHDLLADVLTDFTKNKTRIRWMQSQDGE